MLLLKKIETDEQYQKATKWLVETAMEIEDPLSDMTAEEKTKKMAIYDRTSEAVRLYRSFDVVKDNPSENDILKPNLESIDSEKEDDLVDVNNWLD